MARDMGPINGLLLWARYAGPGARLVSLCLGSGKSGEGRDV